MLQQLLSMELLSIKSVPGGLLGHEIVIIRVPNGWLISNVFVPQGTLITEETDQSPYPWLEQ